MQNPLISVIIPAYNAERTIDRCLTSICNQSYSALEIIVVNDGSKDGTLEKLWQWKAKDSRILVFDQENRGLAGARNTGMDHANGQYIAFVDADDEVGPLLYEKLIAAAQAQNADIVSVAIEEKYNGGVIEVRENDENWPVISGIAAACAMLRYEGGIRTVVWDKLYRSELLKDIRFKKAAGTAEDTMMNFYVFLKCRRYFRIPYIGYTYDHTESQLTAGGYRSSSMGAIYVAEKIRKTCMGADADLHITEEARQLQEAAMQYCVTITRQIFQILLLTGDYKGKDAEDYRHLKAWAQSLDQAFVKKYLSAKDYLQWKLYLHCPQGFLLAHKIHHSI